MKKDFERGMSMKYRLEILRGGKIEDSFEFNSRKEFIAKWYKYSGDSECYPQAIIQGRKLTIAQMERFIELTRKPGECYRRTNFVGR